MVVVGRTHMVEFAYGGWGTNPVQGAPRNPWGHSAHVVAGGSSSGSAVAVSAGLVAAALGTDTGGSIRTPATWCGIVGLKTSVGLVGRGGVVPLCPTHDSVGPMTRSVRDAAIMLEAMAGEDRRDVATRFAPRVQPLDGIEDEIKGLRIGILPERDLDGVEPDIRRLHDRAIADYRALGAQFSEITLPPIRNMLGGGGDIMSVELLAAPRRSPGSQWTRSRRHQARRDAERAAILPAAGNAAPGADRLCRCRTGFRCLRDAGITSDAGASGRCRREPAAQSFRPTGQLPRPRQPRGAARFDRQQLAGRPADRRQKIRRRVGVAHRPRAGARARGSVRAAAGFLSLPIAARR